MTNVINLEEIIFSKKIVKDVPEIIKKIDFYYKELYNYKDYIDVALVLQQLDESSCMLQTILAVYSQILKDFEKGPK